MKGWGPVSLSAGLLFTYPEKGEQKLETTSYPFIGASSITIIQKKCFLKKNIIIIIICIIIIIILIISIYYRHHHSFFAYWCWPCSRSFRMQKTHYNHHDLHQKHDHYHHHRHHCHNHHSQSFSSPLWCQLCLRSFERKISNFPSSRLVTFPYPWFHTVSYSNYFMTSV